MAIKDWLSRKRQEAGGDEEEQELSLEDLIVLERYEEAAEKLKARLKAHPDDLYAHLKLADVCIQLRQGAAAVDEYVYVAEQYARDGFYDKGIALLGKASRLAPLEDELRVKIETLKQAKKLEHKRAAALEGFRQGAGGGTSILPLQRAWHHLARGSLLQGLSRDQVRHLFSGLSFARHPAGTELAAEGAPGEELYLIALGVVEARTSLLDGREATLRTFGSGDILGESVLFERRRWPASYRVTEDAQLLVLDRPGLERALVGNSDPRGLLDALRWQGHDRDVANAVMKLHR